MLAEGFRLGRISKRDLLSALGLHQSFLTLLIKEVVKMDHKRRQTERYFFCDPRTGLTRS